MNPLRVAAVQATPGPGDLPGNVALGAGLVRRAAADGARVAVLPELFLSAYHPPTLHATRGADVAAGPDRRGRGRAARSVAGGGPDARRGGRGRGGGRPGRRPADVFVHRGRPGPGTRSPPTTSRTCGVRTRRRCSPRAPRRPRWRWTAGGWVWVSATTAASPSTGGRRRPTGRTATCARPDIWPARPTAGTSTTRPGRLDNTMYVVFANSVGAVGDLAFNGGAAVVRARGPATGPGGRRGRGGGLRDPGRRRTETGAGGAHHAGRPPHWCGAAAGVSAVLSRPG